jgi:hypothetical protein
MIATNAVPVAIVFANSAMATFPPARWSLMIPDPTIAATNMAVPIASEATRLDKGITKASHACNCRGEEMLSSDGDFSSIN